MAHITLRRAATDADFDDARALCWAWADWLLRTYPEREQEILSLFEPGAFARTLDALPDIHGSPGGAVLLASLDGETMGCVMYQQSEPDVARLRRLFVDEPGRGHGIGRALVAGALVGLRNDGYAAVRLELPVFLDHARRLFDSMGFAEIPAAEGGPEFIRVLERTL